jgi:anaerobic magnesium-protoporphyrin IX monomethyl ester cyclase
MSKVLFSHSYYYKLDSKQWNTAMPYPPLGTIYAASFLRENNHKVSLFDVGLKDGPDDIKSILNTSTPDVLVIYDDGFNYLTKMCLTNMREAAFKMIKYAKNNNCKVIVASSDSTDHYEQYLNKGADFVILGEGEITLLDLVNKLDKNEDTTEVEGICYLNNENQVQKNKGRTILKDLDFLPLPAWDLVNTNDYKTIWEKGGKEFTLNLATTRGCPYKCNWCAKPIYGTRYNSRSPKKVVEEIKYIEQNFGVTKFWMGDDIFGLKPNWVQTFRDELKANNLTIRYKIQSRADLLLQEDNIDALAESGLEEVWVGAESGSQKILDAMDKGTTIAQIKESTALLQSKGIRVAFFLQFGYLGETKKDIDLTIQMLKDFKPDDIGVSVSYPLPGTKFYDVVKSQLGNKSNWTDSDELALMFKSQFNPEFYKVLHRYVHKVFRNNQAKQFISKQGLFSKQGIKQGLKSLYYAPIITYYKNKLNRLENVKSSS